MFAKNMLSRLLVLLLSVSVAFAQTPPPPPPGNPPPPPPQAGQPVISQEELDQMLAPIALYPDSLLSQILMASTYPLEVVQAARWSRSNPNLKGDQAVNAVEQNDWDPSVKSLVAFPQILAMMDEKLDWTEKLGEAFLVQQTQVMDTIQHLRQKAQAAGNLQSNDRMRVIEQPGQPIIVEPANPEVVYVPYYNPAVIYGPWWWPAYPPVYWGPWPGYYVGPTFVSGFAWGIGVPVSVGFFFGVFDWHHHSVNVVNFHNYYRNTPIVNYHAPVVWQHDPSHRRSVIYHEAVLRQKYDHSNAATANARREFRGYAPTSPQVPPQGQSAQGARTEMSRESRTRPQEQLGGTRAIVGSTVPKPDTGTAPNRPIAPPLSAGRPEPRSVPIRPAAPTAQVQPNVFEGVGHGAEVRNYSTRGRESFHPAAPRPSVPAAPSSGHVPAPHPSGNAPATQPSGGPGGGGTIRR